MPYIYVPDNGFEENEDMKTRAENACRDRLPDKEEKRYCENVGKALDTVSEKLYSKGEEIAPPDYISKFHLDRLREGVRFLTDENSEVFTNFFKETGFGIGGTQYKDVTEFFNRVFGKETVLINGVEFLNFPSILRVIGDNEDRINMPCAKADILAI